MMKRIFTKLFLIKWIVSSFLTFGACIFSRVAGIQRYPTHDSLSFEQAWQEFVDNPVPEIMLAMVVGFFVAKYLPKLTLYK
jgi:hypothetical protein